MATYDIPGITTSVEDYSEIQKQPKGNRTILIACPSKFGSEDIVEFTDAEEAKYELGTYNLDMYGKGLKYLNDSFKSRSVVLFKRLVPEDATFSNIFLSKNDSNYDIETIELADPETLTSDPDKLLVHYGKGKGDGYNEFYIKYSMATDIEKVYSDNEGETLYDFNFVKVSIYQKTHQGVKVIMPNTIVSLIDSDPLQNNIPILNLINGESLFINNRVNTKNSFVNCKLNESNLEEIKKNINLDNLLHNKSRPKIILKDIQTGINYMVKYDDSDLYIEATSMTGRDKIIFKYRKNNADNYQKLYVEDGVLKRDTDTDATSSDESYEDYYVKGLYEYIKLFIDPETEDLKKEPYETLRSSIYKKIVKNIFQMQSGTYGKNFIVNNTMNFSVTDSDGNQNVKMALLDFYKHNDIIREVMYPKYDFDYIVDWTCDLEVMNEIYNLADTIGCSLGLTSLPRSTKADIDYKVRTENLFISTMNNMLYSGQFNDIHYDEISGKRVSMPQSYFQMLAHLKIDNEKSITEPVAGIIKGQLQDSNVALSYTISSKDIEKLRNVQINTIIEERDGIYSIDQLTLLKKSSKLSRVNVVKVIHRMRKDLPKLLKEYIQTKEIDDNIAPIENTCSNYMKKWEVTTNGNNPDAIFKSINIKTNYIGEEYKLIVSIRVAPIGTIEKIDIPIIIENEG